jgi:transposase
MHGEASMSEKRYRVSLTEEERAELKGLIKRGHQVAARKRLHAQALLKTDEGEWGPSWTDAQISEAYDLATSTVKSVRQRFVEEGLESALNRKKQQNLPVPRKLDGAAEARLIATVQGPPPEGRSRWTLRLLSDRIIELGICDEPVSHSAIGRALKKTR